MRLQQIRLRGFQSYRQEQQIAVDRHLTILAGRNNVGKSAFLRALRLWVEPREGAAANFELSYLWEVGKDELLAALPADAQVRPLIMKVESHQLLASFTTNRTGEVPAGELTPSRLELPEAGLRSANAGGGALVWSGNILQANTSGIAELSQLARDQATRVDYTAPRRIELQPRQLVYAETELRPDARNLANVLMYLQQSRPRDEWAVLLSFIRDAFPEIDLISVTTVPGQSTSQGEPFVFYHHLPDPVPLRLSGTGVEQLLALASALLLARDPRLVLIDEPQAYLHPHAERSLIRLIDSHRDHRYIVATHSSTLVRSRPLAHVRLLTIGAAGTVVTDPHEAEALLTELGITAADLWMSDRLLWVEGPSERAVISILADWEIPESERLGLAIKTMPDAASRFAGTSPRRAEAAFRFCEESVRAVAPLGARMVFLFDSDEKSQSLRDDISTASGGRAHYFPHAAPRAPAQGPFSQSRARP
jgi:AAA domain, putative AbiEii toxin, Type IV TA system/AAA ATPase domain